MNKPISVSHTFSGTEKTISFETGRLAGLAGGAVLSQLGKSTVLMTATGAKSARPGAECQRMSIPWPGSLACRAPGGFACLRCDRRNS